MNPNCPICMHKDLLAYERLIASGRYLIIELVRKVGRGWGRAIFNFHRDNCMPEEFHGLERVDPKRPPKKPPSVKRRAEVLHRSLSRVLRIGVWQVEQAKKRLERLEAEGQTGPNPLSPQDAEAITKVAAESSKVIELLARLNGEVGEKQRPTASISNVFVLPTTNGKSPAEIAELVQHGPQAPVHQIEATSE